MLRLVSDTYAAGMNTLANHGYISRKYEVLICSTCHSLILYRSGITTFEEIINAVGEAFNINRNQGAGMAAMNIVRMSTFRPIFLVHLFTKAHAGKSLREQNLYRRSLSFRTSPAGSNRWTSDTGNSKTRTGRRLAMNHTRLQSHAQLSKGDASITRADVHIGDNRNFNKTLWDTVGLS
jgi:hypothetical protein